jgi:hypothetical protein
VALVTASMLACLTPGGMTNKSAHFWKKKSSGLLMMHYRFDRLPAAVAFYRRYSFKNMRHNVAP